MIMWSAPNQGLVLTERGDLTLRVAVVLLHGGLHLLRVAVGERPRAEQGVEVIALQGGPSW